MWGKVVAAQVVQTNVIGKTTRGPSYGTVTMESYEDAMCAIKNLNGSELDQSRIKVERAKERAGLERAVLERTNPLKRVPYP